VNGTWDKITTQTEVINRLKVWFSPNIWDFSGLSLLCKHTQIEIWENTFLFLVLYACETWFLTLTEERRFWGAREQGAVEDISA
jgi:hypothetical protein